MSSFFINFALTFHEKAGLGHCLRGGKLTIRPHSSLDSPQHRP